MSWFDDQIRLRKEQDDDAFSDAIESIAGAVIGKKLIEALDNQKLTQSAVEEILRYYHLKRKSNDELPASVKTTEEQLEYYLRPFGISHRTISLDHKWYKQAVGPMLGTLKADGSVIALIPGKFSGYSYYNFQTGERIKVTPKNEDLIDEEATAFYKPLPLRPINMMDLLRYMMEQLSVSDIVLYVGLMGVASLLGLLSPLFTQWLFGDVLESGSKTVLFALAGFMFCFTLCQLFFTAFQSLINSRVNIKQNIAVQAAVMNRVLALPVKFFKDYSSGELTQRAMYVQTLCSSIISTIFTTGLTSLFSLIYIGQIFAFAPTLVVPSLLILLATVAFSVITTFAQMHITKEIMLRSSKTSGMTYSMITGIQKIKLAGAEKRMFSRWAKSYAGEAKLEYNPPLFLKLSGTINLALNLLGSLLLYSIAIKSQISVANFYAFNASYGMVSAAFMSLAGIASIVANIKPTLEMAKPIMDASPEIASDKEIVTELHGAIELEHVSFAYEEGMPNVIDDLSLRITPGEYIAIVGSTGCGKSTLMRLLLGFETPQKGAIYYDRKNISRLDLKSLRRKIGAVMQDGKLFLGDIYSNIVIAAPSLTLEQAWEAAEIASAADAIRAMPMGMHTIISEGSGGISGGQRQRLMIARAIAPKPKVLMFDEATSALDNVTQKKVSEAIDKMKCTRIVIAHRLSTIRHCDRIIVLNKGKIVEDGTYDSLIEKQGFFAELVARQRIDVETD